MMLSMTLRLRVVPLPVRPRFQGWGDRAQPPQPQQAMQPPVLLGPPGTRYGSVVLGQELLMKPGRQHAEDL
jgi:hypothetical protein